MLRLIFAGILIAFAIPFCKKATDGFEVGKIQAPLPYKPSWETEPLASEKQQEIEAILSQKFHYLASGGQSYVFLSDDGRYVVKFFKLYRYLIPSTLAKVPFLEKKLAKTIEARWKKVERDFDSYKLAWDLLPEETGLVYIHLNPTQGLKSPIVIRDKLNIEHVLDSNRFSFIIQERAELLCPRLLTCRKENDLAKAKATLEAISEVVAARCKKGVFDQDPRLHKNFGFVGDKPIFIDVGRFTLDEQRKDPEIYQQDLADMTQKLKQWLQINYPELL